VASGGMDRDAFSAGEPSRGPSGDPQNHLLASYPGLFSVLNLLPLFKHFHIITALPNVFFKKMKKGEIKPARYGVEDIFDLETLGVERIEDLPGSISWISTPAPNAAAARTTVRPMPSADPFPRSSSPSNSGITPMKNIPSFPLRPAAKSRNPCSHGGRNHRFRRIVVLHHLRRLRGGVSGIYRIYQ
jgi:hypothetical protein